MTAAPTKGMTSAIFVPGLKETLVRMGRTSRKFAYVELELFGVEDAENLRVHQYTGSQRS
jgi:hypothetical protein